MNAMSKASYTEIIEESSASGRQQEAAAIAHSIELMNGAEAETAQPKDTVIALHFTRRLWELLLRDLASPENGLPRSLRADLIWKKSASARRSRSKPRSPCQKSSTKD